MHFKTMSAVIASSVFVTLISGCANTSADYEPLVDGRKDAVFYADLADCKKLAEKREYLNGDSKSEALLGAGLGALAGAGGSGGDLLGGALLGGIVGAGSGAWDTRKERKNIVINCMSNRGHNVVG